MSTTSSSSRSFLFQSISFKNIMLFLLILLVALVPLAWRYYQDSRDYEISILASKLEFFAERGASWIDVANLVTLDRPEQMQTPDYRELVKTLNRIQSEFEVDNAIVMRRESDGQYTYIASGTTGTQTQPSNGPATRNPCHPHPISGASTIPAHHNPCHPSLVKQAAVHNPCHPALTTQTAVQHPCHPHAVSNPCATAAKTARGFALGEQALIHRLFPDTYKATEETWQQGSMMHSRLFGGEVNNQRFDQFLQINNPLKIGDQVVAILMLNKFANPVAAAVRIKTIWVVGLSGGILLLGVILFAYSSARMLQPLKELTAAANEVAQGNLNITLPAQRNRDEVGRLAHSFDTMIEGLRQRDFIRDTFGRYLSQEVVEELLDSPDGLKLGGETREVTFLVSDLRGFTSLSSNLPPNEVIDLLNRYLERMIDVISNYRGTVDEFQGDGILAFFGAPFAATHDQERAIACAIAMQAALIDLNDDQRQHGRPELNMGIGINTGEVILGNIGSEKRTKYGAVGSAINEAYRIESFTVGGQILIGPSVYQGVRDLVDIESTQDVQFKGLDHAVTLYEVAGLQGDFAISMPGKTPELVTPLSAPLPISCFPIDGKIVSSQAISGTITHLTETTAEAVLDGQVMLHSNLMLRLAPLGAPTISEVYAKVVAVHPNDASFTRVRLGFTSVPEPAKALLKRQCETT